MEERDSSERGAASIEVSEGSSGEPEHEERALELLVRKVAVLKKALLQERAAKHSAEDKNLQLQRENDDKTQQLRQKEEACISLFKENEELQERLRGVSTPLEVGGSRHSADGRLGRPGTMPGFLGTVGLAAQQSGNNRAATEIRRLANSLRLAENELKQLGEELSSKDKELTELRHSYKESLSAVQGRMYGFEEDIDYRDDKIHQLTEERRKISEMNMTLMNEQQNLQKEIAYWKKRYRQRDEVYNELKESTGQKEEEYLLLRKQLAEQKEVTEKMAAKLLEYKDKLSAFHLELSKWSVRKIRSLLPAENGQIHVYKNPQTGVLNVDVIIGDTRATHNITEVANVQMVDVEDYHNRFAIVYASQDEHREVFECDRAEDCVATLREYMKAYSDHIVAPSQKDRVMHELSIFFGRSGAK